jgi:uncharacterized membrane protein YidH (DUF202 family)
MTARRLQLALSILSIGFALEGLAELYTALTPGATTPGETELFVLPTLLALVGLILVWVGRDEWSRVHGVRTQAAEAIYSASLLGAFVAIGIVFLLFEDPAIGTPVWVRLTFGAAVGSLVFGTFVTYAYLIHHLVSRPMRGVIYAALGWAVLISVAVAILFANGLPNVLTLASQPSLSVPPFLAPLDTLVSYLFVSFFLLLAANLEAQVAVARGVEAVPGLPGIPVHRTDTAQDTHRA